MRKRFERRRVQTWETVGGACSFVAGVLAALIGSLIAVSGWIVGPNQHPGLRATGTVLLILAILLIIFAGFCLDWAEQEHDESLIIRKEKSERGSVQLGQVARLAALTSAALFCPLVAHAQQTIFNVPTTDVLDKGKVYAELDVSFKPNNDPGNVVQRFSSFVPRIVVGTGGHVEVGLNVTGNINPGADSTALVGAFKSKLYDGGDNGWAIVAGNNLFIPLRNKSYDIGNYFYAQASKTFKKRTRFTFGGYHFSDNVVATNAQRAGGQFGVEHAINPKFSLAADWYTGKHAFGYFTPGIIFKPQPRVTGYASYSLGNTNLSHGNHFFLWELGYNFN